MADKRRIKPKSKAYIKETTDIIENTHDDDLALQFLKDSLDDDYPDMDLASMDLHEAIKVLGSDGNEKEKDSKGLIEDLNASLTDFINSQKKEKPKVKKKRRRRRKRK